MKRAVPPSRKLKNIKAVSPSKWIEVASQLSELTISPPLSPAQTQSDSSTSPSKPCSDKPYCAFRRAPRISHLDKWAESMEDLLWLYRNYILPFCEQHVKQDVRLVSFEEFKNLARLTE